MTVLFRCHEDNTLCLAEAKYVYWDSTNETACITVGKNTRCCDTITTYAFEQQLTNAIKTGKVDFSVHCFYEKCNHLYENENGKI